MTWADEAVHHSQLQQQQHQFMSVDRRRQHTQYQPDGALGRKGWRTPIVDEAVSHRDTIEAHATSDARNEDTGSTVTGGSRSGGGNVSDNGDRGQKCDRR